MAIKIKSCNADGTPAYHTCLTHPKLPGVSVIVKTVIATGQSWASDSREPEEIYLGGRKAADDYVAMALANQGFVDALA
jgi:hypothetical protein